MYKILYCCYGWIIWHESEDWRFEFPWARYIFCLKNFDTFTRTSVHVSKINAVAYAQLTFQMSTLLKKYIWHYSVVYNSLCMTHFNMKMSFCLYRKHHSYVRWAYFEAGAPFGLHINPFPLIASKASIDKSNQSRTVLTDCIGFCTNNVCNKT